MSARLWAVGKHNLITIQTNSTWEQKIKITGEGLDKTITGSGERKILWETWEGPGSFLIEAWFRRPTSSDWVPSKLIHGRYEHGIYFVGANDDGPDRDYNDALVSSYAVTKAALESTGEFLDSLGD